MFDVPLVTPDTLNVIWTPPLGIVSSVSSATAASTVHPTPAFSLTYSYTLSRSSPLTAPLLSFTESDPDSTSPSKSFACWSRSSFLTGDGLANTVVIPIENTISAASIPANFLFIGFSSFL
jgi:hypothetical protein